MAWGRARLQPVPLTLSKTGALAPEGLAACVQTIYDTSSQFLPSPGMPLLRFSNIQSMWISHQLGADAMVEKTVEKVTKTESEWKKQLTPEQYHVTREAGTECAFTGK